MADKQVTSSDPRFVQLIKRARALKERYPVFLSSLTDLEKDFLTVCDQIADGKVRPNIRAWRNGLETANSIWRKLKKSDGKG